MKTKIALMLVVMTSIPLALAANDSDGDGVADAVELSDGTNPDNGADWKSFSKGLLLCYRFEGDASDISGNGGNATLSGGPGFVPGVKGQAISFDGVNDHFARTPVPITSNPFTYSIWVKIPASRPFGSWLTVFQQGQSYQYSPHFSAILPDAGHYQFGGYTWTGGYSGISSPSMVCAQPNDWHHLVWTSTPEGNRKLYFDGTESASTTGQAFGEQNSWLRLGGNIAENIYDAYSADEFRVYNRALSAGEVASMYANQAPAQISISGFTPSSGPTGTSVTITGSNFTGATAVRFGGVDASSFTVDSATQITAAVPTGAVSGTLTVVTPSGTATSVGTFTVEPFPFTYSVSTGAVIITGYTGPGGHVVIPESIDGLPVTGISSGAFDGKTAITALTLPSTLQWIAIHDPQYNTHAFRGCSNLTSFIVAAGNPNFRAVSGVLYNHDGTELICCPPGLPGNYSVPDGVLRIGGSAFYGCGELTDITFPGSVESLGAWAFSGCGVTSVVIPPRVTEIGYCTFNNCVGLANVTIPSGVTRIWFSAFAFCPLTTVCLPASVTQIDSYAFVGCPNLASVYFIGNAPACSQPESTFQDSPCTIYRLAGATGWPEVPGPWSGRPTALWIYLSVTGFSPSQGFSGDSVTITGTNFTDVSAVKFGGVNALFTTDSATQITATVPAGGQTGPITVVSAYDSATSPGVFTVTRLAQSISFDPIADKRLSMVSFLPNAIASSGLPVSYESSNTAVATVSGNAVILVGRGTATITARQAGDETYEPAAGVDRTLTVVGGSIAISTPDEAALDSALAGRYDTVVFACDGTITLSTTKTIAEDIILDASGHNLTLGGGSVLRPLQVESGVHLTLRGLIIANGSAAVQGGGILNNGGSLTALDCTFSNNQCNGGTGGGASGGAIANVAGGTLDLTNCTFVQNRANGGAGSPGAYGGYQGGAGGNGYGGAIHQNGGTIHLTNCTFHANTAGGGTGGTGGNGVNGYQYWHSTGFGGYWVTVPGGPGGRGGDGGSGIGGSLHSASGSVVMLNVTMASGAAQAGNGGMPGNPGYYGSGNYGYGYSGNSNRGSNIAVDSGACTAGNTIIANGYPVANCSGTLIDNGSNLSSDATPAFSVASSHNSTNPVLAANPANNGGPTATLALSGDSPAINAGSDATAPLHDQRGLPRVGGTSDIGSFEYQLFPEITGFTPDNGTVGSQVVISGSNFISITEVLIGGVSASFTIDSPNQITAVVPSGAQNGVISISARVGGVASGTAFNVVRLPQSIDFGTLSNRRIDSGSFVLSAVASSGLPVSYESSNTDVATVTGNTVNLTGRGSVTITARQAGSEVYLPATDVSQSFQVTGIPPVIGGFSPSSSTIASAAEGDVIAFSISATDPEPGDVITHTWFMSTDGGGTWQPLGVSGNAPSIAIPHEVVQHPATSLSGGACRIKDVLSDGYGGNAEQSWTITSVADRNRVPGYARPVGSGQWAWRATNASGAPTGRHGPTSVWAGGRMIAWGGGTGSTSPVATGGLYDPVTNTWRPTSSTNAPSARMSHSAVSTGVKMIIWGGDTAGWSYTTTRMNTGGIYDPSTHVWTPTSTTGAPSGRRQHSAVWTGNRMIIWGGSPNSGQTYQIGTNTGGIYDPESNSWIPTSTVNAPSPRFQHGCVWTGTRMIVWGGQRGESGTYVDTNTGGIYDPATDSWTTMSTANAPSVSTGRSCAWIAGRMYVWGGGNSANPTNLGWSYNPETNVWESISNSNAPSSRYSPSQLGLALVADGRMFVWGGYDNPSSYTPLSSGGLYDPSGNSWTAAGTAGAPPAAVSGAFVWSGTSAIVWGGQEKSGAFVTTGGVYCPAPEPVLTPASPVAGQALTCTVASPVDPDGEDMASLTYEFSWLKNGAVQVTHSTNSPTDILPKATTAAGESWSCRVIVRDSSASATPPGISSAVIPENRPPVISGFSPGSGPVGSQIVINGSDFVNVTSVTIGGISAFFTVDSTVQITAAVPGGFVSGVIRVVAQLGTDTSVTEFVATTTLAEWRAERFTADQLADPLISGDQASPAHDGISNLMKYALALDPMVCGAADLPYPDKAGGYLTLTYRQNKQAGDITFTVEAGDSLIGNDWQPATTELSRTNEGDHWLVTVRDSVPISSSPTRFMRLKVSR